jgi:hypothetical protein
VHENQLVNDCLRRHGGALHRCRQELLETSQSPALSSAIVPVTPEAVLRLVLNLEAGDTAPDVTVPEGHVPPSAVGGSGVLKAVLWTSLAWLAVLALTAAGFLGVLREQDRKLELLQERLPAPGDPCL